MMPTVALRNVIKISVAPKAKQIVEQTAEKHGMKEIAVASRLYEWFAEQDEVVRAEILKQIPESIRRDVGQIVLERMAGGGNSGGKKRGG